MAKWVELTSLDEFPVGSVQEFTAEGRIIALFHVEDEVRAIDGICAHAGGPLGEGQLQGCIVTCPWHGWQYDVKTGEMCLNSTIQQEQFSVKIEGNTIMVELP